MNKQQKSTAGGGRRSNQTPPSGKNPNRDSNDGPDMRQARMDEQKELKEEASLPDDPDPALDEQDLEENHLSMDEADKIEWDPQAKQDKKSGL
ncbi:MAG TPA: hypothetical protein VHC96_21260 [Puia sp.]|jgi:hypothetical protein|nr:hypothetical protein [Puia sp.]